MNVVDELFATSPSFSVLLQDDEGGKGGAIYNAGLIVIREIAEFPSNIGGVNWGTSCTRKNDTMIKSSEYIRDRFATCERSGSKSSNVSIICVIFGSKTEN